MSFYKKRVLYLFFQAGNNYSGLFGHDLMTEQKPDIKTKPPYTAQYCTIG
ncbi:hypothetical protein KKJ17_07110 [Xenorhabdus bovienii]|nr:hypothetical protein [Xenorhabdus bovienii]MDE1483382.1 hypothetical protein [Xenorhabdus bovienii]MDE9433413.1 hypothetical protein [Xenorhabdus bovienii]MDE9442464.1 hypothetical protein [Xenorhabdus bovienii]MDE9464697.1 hypothetical protein [Xenorhabdus bovienii]MDE9491238.1 hypothetical protein [Xenorhabdus bovienii]